MAAWWLRRRLCLCNVNVDTVSKFISITHIRFELLTFLGSLVTAVITTYLSTIVKAGLGAQEAAEQLGKEIVALSGKFDLPLYIAEYERGLFPPIRWIARAQIKKAISGDLVAGARMIAKLSQVQALLVFWQSVFAVAAIGAMAFGLRLQ